MPRGWVALADLADDAIAVGAVVFLVVGLWLFLPALALIVLGVLLGAIWALRHGYIGHPVAIPPELHKPQPKGQEKP